jgi:ankyrin repeat protein
LSDAVDSLLGVWENGLREEEPERRKTVENLLNDPATIVDFDDPPIGGLLLYLQDEEDPIFRLLVSRDVASIQSDLISSPSPSVLCWAARNGNESLMRRLLAEPGVQPDLRDSAGRTPVSYAAESGAEGVVKLLLASQLVAADSKDENGVTPLWWAIINGRENVVKLLLDYNADVPKIEDVEKLRSLLFDVAIYNWTTILKILVDHSDDDGGFLATTTDCAGRTLLLNAAENGNEAILEILLSKPSAASGLNIRDNCGRTALWYAASKGHDAVVRILLAQDGIDVNSMDNQGITPLSDAVSQYLRRRQYPKTHRSNAEIRKVAVLELILAHPAVDITSVDEEALQTLLSRCAESGHGRTVELLAQKGHGTQ